MGTRGYDAPRRRAQAAETRAEIVAAARRLFVSRGWGATTVRDVAREAGVSEPTVYNAVGGKPALALALVDEVDASGDVARERAAIAEAEGDPRRQLAAMVAFDRRLFEAGADAIRLLREGGRTEEDLAAAYHEGRGRGEAMRKRVFGSWPAGVLAIDVPTACDLYGGLCNVDVWTNLLEERGWSPDRIEQWWNDSLTRQLLLP